MDPHLRVGERPARRGWHRWRDALGRLAYAVELKSSYYRQMVRNMVDADEKASRGGGAQAEMFATVAPSPPAPADETSAGVDTRG